ncbi:MAG: GNAT family N-acetyltransferase [Gammaproteobacteria bacterium]|nr:GNAT family N-acetyltransferase [Gammaproteobacteria bacterium]
MSPDTDGLRFEAARNDERDVVENICRAAFEPYVARLGRQLSKDAYDNLPLALAQGHVWVARRGEQTLGVVVRRELVDTWKLDDIVVAPAAQHAGIGTWMIERVEALAHEQGVRKLTLDTAKMMTHLVDWYTRLGFEIVTEGRPEHGRDAHPRVFMEKRLT